MMNGKECRATRREIDESELNQKLSDQARSHVASCASCRGFRAERISLRELVGSLEPVTAPGDFDVRLRARLASERQGRTRQPSIFRLVIGAPAIAAAALVVILALAMVWFAQRNRSQSPEVAKVAIPEAPVAPQQPAPAVNSVQTGQGTSSIALGNSDVKPDQSSRPGNAARGNNGKFASAGIKAVDYGVSRAESIKQIEQRAGEVSLSAPLKPMVVSMQDDRGATHKISLPPVSFGAQRLVDNRMPLSFSPNSRSW
jgi:hypothetical protein